MNDLPDSHHLRFCVGVLAGADRRAAFEEFFNRVFAVARFQGAERRATFHRGPLVVNATLRVLPDAGFDPLPSFLFFLCG